MNGMDEGMANDGANGTQSASAAALTELAPVQVCVRLRPLLAWERGDGHECTALELGDGPSGTVALKHASGDARKARNFRFDAVIGPERSQEDVWKLAGLEALVTKVVEGFHATVFAYGQTGSGKTHTMEGYVYEHTNGPSAPSAATPRPRVRPQDTPSDQLGIVPRAVGALFTRLEKLRCCPQVPNQGVQLRVSFLQIYNEHIYDLLNPPMVRGSEEPLGLRLRWDALAQSFFVENLFSYECQSAEEVLKHYNAGVLNKQVAATAMNATSSRSHTIFILTLVRRSSLADSDGPHPPPVREIVSKLSLVDLAGSERASASTGNAARFQEAVNVNQSLFVLRRVITALSKRTVGDARFHVPYRDSKLTSLLQHAIGGNGFLLMLACLSPSDKHHEENLSTLQYAAQAADIKNEPLVNLDPKDKLIQDLRAKLTSAHAYILRMTGLTKLPTELLEAKPPSGPRRGRCLSARNYRACSAERGLGATAPLAGVQEGARSGPPMVLRPSSSRPRALTACKADLGAAAREDKANLAVACTESSSTSLQATPAASSAAGNSEGEDLFAAADAALASYSPSAGRKKHGCPSAEARKPSQEEPRRCRPPAPRALPPVARQRQQQSSPRHMRAQQPNNEELADEPAPPQAVQKPAASALSQSMQSGIWDAVEELRAAKGDLERQLKVEEGKRQELEKQLVALREKWEAAAFVAVQEQRRLEAEVAGLAATRAEAEATRRERERLAIENGGLRAERASLQQRLDVFFQALEQEESKSVGQQVEGLHSKLVLESVALRGEVARLKKKKWVISAVLAHGGESEQQAIDEEVALSRMQSPAPGDG